jgi:hypothetical protein
MPLRAPMPTDKCVNANPYLRFSTDIVMYIERFKSQNVKSIESGILVTVAAKELR